MQVRCDLHCYHSEAKTDAALHERQRERERECGSSHLLCNSSNNVEEKGRGGVKVMYILDFMTMLLFAVYSNFFR